MLRLVLLIGFVLVAVPALGQSVVIDLLQNVNTFTGEPGGRPQANLELLQSSENNLIANACIEGASLRRLEKLEIPDLKQRLQVLTDGHVLTLAEGIYTLSFPVISGQARVEFEGVVHEKAATLAPSVGVMIGQIRDALPANQDVVFHLLWSRVMDRMWYRTWQLEGRPGTGPPFVRWVIYPEDRFAFGTASYGGVLGGGSNAISWDRKSICGGFHPGSYQEVLLRGAWGEKVRVSGLKTLQSFGLFNSNGTFEGFAYHANGPLDRLLTELTDRYAKLVSNAYDYGTLSKKWRIPVNNLWIAMQHETAYAILGDLVESRKLTIPAPLRGKGDRNECRQIISLRLVTPQRACTDLEEANAPKECGSSGTIAGANSG